MKKKTMHLTIPADLVDWVDRKVDERKYHNQSHAVEVALMELKRKETVKL